MNVERWKEEDGEKKKGAERRKERPGRKQSGWGGHWFHQCFFQQIIKLLLLDYLLPLKLFVFCTHWAHNMLIYVGDKH